MKGFNEGYDYFQKSVGAITASFDTYDFMVDRKSYVKNVQDQIDLLEKEINAFKGYNTDTKSLKGFVAEVWHADTFNVNAATNHSDHRAFVLNSNDYASVDIGTNFRNNYGLKYYQNGEMSAKAQAISVFQKFKEYQGHGGKDDLYKYLQDRHYDGDAMLNDPLYRGQIRIIPHDQFEDAVKYLHRMIATEQARRPENVARYQETLKMLETKIKDDQGHESIVLTKDEAEKLAKFAKEGNFKAEDYNISAPDLLNDQLIIKQALKSGMNAAVISLALKLGPEIYKTIDYLIKNGEIEEETFKRLGFAALTGTSEGFLRGIIASAITMGCQSGALGSEFTRLSPSVISAVTVITVNTIKNAFLVARGQKSRSLLAQDLMRDLLMTTSSLTAGTIGQVVIPVPVLGYLIGSMIGSIAGSFMYTTVQQTTLSFCAETGITLFGLVDQNYRLPGVVNDIGLATFNYETFSVDTFEPKHFEPETFNFDTFQPESFDIKFLHRGVIGINRIGFVK